MVGRVPSLLAAALLVAALVDAPAARATVPVLVVDGKGFGHGVGMAQDGAYWMGLAGASSGRILGQFYPGTGFGRAGGQVRAAVLGSPSGHTDLTFPSGGEVRDAPSGPQSPGFPVGVGPGGTVHVWFDGSSYHAQAAAPPASGNAAGAGRSGVVLASWHGQTLPTQPPPSTTTTRPILPPRPTTTTTRAPTPTTQPGPGPSPTTTAPPPPPPGPAPPPAGPEAVSSRPLWSAPANGGTTGVPDRGRHYRGTVEVLGAGTGLRLVDQLDVEQYLLGLGEMPASWPAAALQAQAVAARTYALRAMSIGGEICDDQRCQVYIGADNEHASSTKATNDTRGQVLVFGGTFAVTVYSANAGGISATAPEGFGSNSDYPYLRASPYTTHDPDPWTVRIGLADLATRFGYSGAVSGARITHAGPSGRALEVTLDGSNGPKALAGPDFTGGLGLRSTLYALRVDQEDTAPPAPAAADLIQVLPDDAAATAATPATADATAALPRLPGAPKALTNTRHHNTRGGWVVGAILALLAAAAAATKRGAWSRTGVGARRPPA